MSCEYSVCVFVLRGFTGARNRDLLFIALRMMTLLPLSSLHLPLFLMPYGMRKIEKSQHEQTSQGGRKQDREEMRKAGGGRNTLAFYPECHSSWQRQSALPLAAGPQPLPAFMGFMSHYDGAQTFMPTYILWTFMQAEQAVPRLSIFNFVGI